MEGEIRAALARLGIAVDAREASPMVASRTDRGVSARANALAITSPLPPTAMLRALNGISPEIWFTGLAEVAPAFRPRGATSRWYRYWERPADRVPDAWTRGAEAFRGRFDARSFGRGLPAGTPTWWSLERLTPTVDGGWLVLDVRARSFIWGMVRKIVSALREVESGGLTVDELRTAIEGGRRLALPLAEPDRLVLWETSYPVAWTIETAEGAARQARHLRSAAARSAARHEILSRIAAEVARERP